MEFALETNISAIPTCTLYSFLHACVCTSCPQNRPQSDALVIISRTKMNQVNTGTCSRRWLPMQVLKGTGSPQMCLPSSLQTESSRGEWGSEVSIFFYHFLKTWWVLRAILNHESIPSLENKVSKTSNQKKKL